MRRASVKHQAANVLSPIPADGEDKTNFNDALPVLTIVPVDIENEAEGNAGEHDVENEALKVNEAGLRAVSKNATKISLLTELTTA